MKVGSGEKRNSAPSAMSLFCTCKRCTLLEGISIVWMLKTFEESSSVCLVCGGAPGAHVVGRSPIGMGSIEVRGGLV